MNIMRVNCSHATYEEIDLRVANLRQAIASMQAWAQARVQALVQTWVYA